MNTIFIAINWEVAFSFLLFLIITIPVLYWMVIKALKYIDYLNKVEKVEIYGVITEIIDKKEPILIYNSYQNDFYNYGPVILLDKDKNPVIVHEYSVGVQVENNEFIINLEKQELSDRIIKAFKDGARMIRISCNKVVHNGRLIGEEILFL